MGYSIADTLIRQTSSIVHHLPLPFSPHRCLTSLDVIELEIVAEDISRRNMSDRGEQEPLLGRPGDAAQEAGHPIYENLYLGKMLENKA
jgi:hypothetical protein